MIKICYVVVIADKAGSVVQIGNDGDYFETFDAAKNCALALRKVSPSCVVNPMKIMRKV